VFRSNIAELVIKLAAVTRDQDGSKSWVGGSGGGVCASGTDPYESDLIVVRIGLLLSGENRREIKCWVARCI